jgi:hypothetical protein
VKADRGIIFAAIVLLHAAGLLAWLFFSRTERPEEPEAVVFLPIAPITADAPQPDGASRPRAPGLAASGVRRRQTSGPPPPAPASAPSTLADFRAAADAVVGQRTQAPGPDAFSLSPHPHVLPGPVARGPAFGWDNSVTHRVEEPDNPGDGTVVHLNDRCELLIFLQLSLPKASCKLGRMESRGDLFEHLHDPPAPPDSGGTTLP